MVRVLVLALATILAIASSSPILAKSKQVSDATQEDYGPQLEEAVAQSLARAFLDQSLRDPYSAHVDWLPQRKEIFRLKAFEKKVPGYVLRANVNAKNGFGAFTGIQPYDFLFYRGQLFAMKHWRSNGLSEVIKNPAFTGD